MQSLLCRQGKNSTSIKDRSVVSTLCTQLPAHTSPGHPVSLLPGWGGVQQFLSPALNGPSPGQALPWTTQGRVEGSINQSRLNLGERVILWFLYGHKCVKKKNWERLDDF